MCELNVFGARVISRFRMETAPITQIPQTAGPPIHIPVLRDEVLTWLAPRDGGRYCDATLGFGGHAAAILSACGPTGRLWGLDRDADAIAGAGAVLAGFGGRAVLLKTPFSRIRQALEEAGALPLDGCLVDLGVSSPQLDRAERGFSFGKPGPLDMRMDQQGGGETAAEYLQRVDEEELESVLRDLGEERYARSITRAIVNARQIGPIETTMALASLVARSVPTRERHKNPATRTFQALRIVVNHELEELAQFLEVVTSCLAPGGRLLVIAFHSLEDRVVKRKLRALAAKGDEPPTMRILTKHVVWPSDEEARSNPRSRSARLRVAEKVTP